MLHLHSLKNDWCKKKVRPQSSGFTELEYIEVKLKKAQTLEPLGFQATAKGHPDLKSHC